MKANIDNFKKDLIALMKWHKVSLGVEMEGDTHGVECNFMVFDADDLNCANGYILSHYSNYLDIDDLQE